MSDERLVGAAARARAALAAGRSLDDVLRALRHEDRLGLIELVATLREVTSLRLGCAKELVSRACEGRRLDHLGAAELAQLAAIPSVSGEAWWLPLHLERAIIDRAPWNLFVPGGEGWVKTYTAREPDPRAEGWISGVSFAAAAEEARWAAAEPAWSQELAIERDEPEALLLHFIRVVAPG